MAATANYKLFTPLTLADDLVLKNRVVMSPMTRARADIQTHTPTDLQALYYEQRAGAGLIITEATTISEHSFGWIGSPALYTQEHVDAWKKVVDRVHAKNGKIFVQIWHMGRLVHPSFNAKGDVVSASDVQLTEGHTRDAYGNEAAFVKPRPLEVDEITGIAEDFRRSAELAKLAGFDGVEVHASGGYLVDQFLQANTNKRTDQYGGSFENRARFLFQILDAVKTVWPANHIGVRISPNGAYGQMGNPDNYDMFTYVMKRLSAHKLAYLAIQDGFGFGYHDKGRLVTLFDAKSHFQGPVIATNSYTRDIAEGAVRSGGADMVAFGRLYMSNPDLAERFQNDWPLNPDAGYEAYWDPREGEKGYTTFPAYAQSNE
ncbi:hypothetical protein Poli38472_001118 [Pythium oligandrum]|uniref:NADH:flavin oxidoreductase/NADH oxidase N-terminal domain-containing protein n=1 Tax=Pythium oligandrum TaxID=41045 RepID=A0A8K1CSB3_PYTOL|nr:hypothetical protein Poli38472_001118 [Pythium oligandrum]|eukprot:TMW68962.1 hypothetical protein Poli38472_001118 [Pythium oligandrum]